MFGKPSLTTRIVVGKSTGFAVGLIGLVLIPFFWPDEGWALRFGILFWYTTMGAVIGIFGVLDVHPILRFRMPFWFRGPVLGAWMNFVLVLLMYDRLQALMDGIANWQWLASASPWWFVLEGALVGLLIGWLTTRFGGEGKETLA